MIGKWTRKGSVVDIVPSPKPTLPFESTTQTSRPTTTPSCFTKPSELHSTFIRRWIYHVFLESTIFSRHPPVPYLDLPYFPGIHLIFVPPPHQVCFTPTLPINQTLVLTTQAYSLPVFEELPCLPWQFQARWWQ